MVEFHGPKVTFKLALALAVVFGFRLPSVALARWSLRTPRTKLGTAEFKF